MRVQSDANTTGVVTWLHGDHLGSASVATDASGNKIAGSDTRYMPYGEPRAGFVGNGLPTDRRYTGQISIAGGLIDFNARYLDPLLGRFVSADSIVPNSANPQSLNRYAMVFNNPAKYVDLTGHDPWYREEWDSVSNIKEFGLDLQKQVSTGSLQPVEALARLSDRTWAVFNGNVDNYMWAMTLLLTGFDAKAMSPSAFFQNDIGITSAERGWNNYWLGFDWLPYKGSIDPRSHLTSPGDGQGRWNAILHDGTSNQAFHFWSFVALTYYENGLLALGANFMHDPYMIAQRDTWKDLRDMKSPPSDPVRSVLWQWAHKFIDGGAEVSKQDYFLGLAGVTFGIHMHTPCIFGACANPSEWLRTNLTG